MAGSGFVSAKRVGNEGTTIEIVGVQRFERLDPGFTQFGKKRLGNFVVGVGNHLASGGIDNIACHDTAKNKVLGNSKLLQRCSGNIADVLGRNTLVLGDDDLAVGTNEVEACGFTAQALRHERELDLVLGQQEGIELEELCEDFLGRHTNRLEQRGNRHLPSTVNSKKQRIFRIELEIKPRTAVGNDACREKQLARTMGLAAIMLKENARRAMQLGNDDTFRTIDDKRAIGRHERNLAHIDFLLLDFLHGIRRFAIHDYQANPGAQRRSESQSALLAFCHIKRRSAQHETDELESGIARVRNDREDRGERSLQAFVLALFSGNFCLQECSIGLELRRQQERNIKHASALGEALADAFLLGEGVSHGNSVRIKSNMEPVETGKRKRAPLPVRDMESTVCVCRLALFKFVFWISETCCTKHKRADG